MDNLIISYEIIKQPLICIPTDFILPQFEKLCEELICEICLGVVYNPVICGICLTPYGSECLSSWFINHKNKCPKRCSFVRMELPLITKKIMNKIEFNCMHKDKGCNAIIHYEDFYTHVNSCDYADYKCLIDGCSETGPKGYIQAHVHQCDNYLHQCNYCKTVMKSKEYYYHMKNLDNCIKLCVLEINKKEVLIEELNNKVLNLEYENKTLKINQSSIMATKNLLSYEKENMAKVISRLEKTNKSLNEKIIILEREKEKVKEKEDESIFVNFIENELSLPRKKSIEENNVNPSNNTYSYLNLINVDLINDDGIIDFSLNSADKNKKCNNHSFDFSNKFYFETKICERCRDQIILDGIYICQDCEQKICRKCLDDLFWIK